MSDGKNGDANTVQQPCCETTPRWETVRDLPHGTIEEDPATGNRRFIIEGEGFDKDVRSTLRTLKKNAVAVNPDCGIVILAHARTGTANIIQAGGFDAANFGKDSKALFSTARAVVNIAPFDASENPDLAWIPAKNNNGKRPEPSRITLDPDTLTYSRVDVLDVEQWQASIKAAARSNGKRPEFDPDNVKKMLQEPLTKTELHNLIRESGVTEAATRGGIKGMLRTGSLIEKNSGKRNQKLIGTPESFKPDKSDIEFVEFNEVVSV